VDVDSLHGSADLEDSEPVAWLAGPNVRPPPGPDGRLLWPQARCRACARAAQPLHLHRAGLPTCLPLILVVFCVLCVLLLFWVCVSFSLGTPAREVPARNGDIEGREMEGEGEGN
jgi:hypothetical protein